MADVGVIAIGRNEGERLRRCLASVAGGGFPVVSVDSGSTDGSVALAGSMGAEVVELDMSLPFSAARARNAGFDRLMRAAPEVKFVQFVDGDCEVVEGWIAAARRELESRPDAAVVCGRRRERFPEASVYNRLADVEWNTPLGEVKSCGGDAMMRVEALQQVGGYDPSVVAGEEPELCQRLRERGWKILRAPAEMTLHDSAMLHFGQWWRRTVRSGYGAADVAARFGQKTGLFVKHVRSARWWAVEWPLVVLCSFVLTFLNYVTPPFRMPAGWALRVSLGWTLLVVALWPLQVLRIAWRVRGRAPDWRTAFAYGVFTMVGKWANYAGQLRYKRDRRAGKLARMIEYKPAAAVAARAL